MSTEVPKQWDNFVHTLEDRCEIERVPFMVDDLPQDFVSRPKELNPLIGSLLEQHRGEPVAITTALKGAGGYTVKVWGLEGGYALHTLTGHTGCVKALAVTPDGRRAISASHDCNLKIWDVDTGDL